MSLLVQHLSPLYAQKTPPSEGKYGEVPKKIDITLGPIPTPIVGIAILGVALLAFAALTAVSMGYGPGTLWLATAEAAAGIVVLAIAIVCFSLRKGYFEKLNLPTQESIEDYTEILNNDRNNTYSYIIPQFTQNYTEELSYQSFNNDEGNFTEKDLVLYSHNLSDVKDDIKSFIKPTVTENMLAALRSRYGNENLNIRVEKGPNSQQEPYLKYNMISNENGSYLEVTALYQINNHQQLQKTGGNWSATRLKYVKAKTFINLQTGQATISWESPQDKKPEL